MIQTQLSKIYLTDSTLNAGGIFYSSGCSFSWLSQNSGSQWLLMIA